MKMPVFRSFFRSLMRSVCDFVGIDYCSAKDYKSDYKSSISSKSKCALRAVIAFFVASATLITTFVIAPSSALSASQDGAQQNVERSTNAQNNVQQSSAQNNSAQNGINKDEVKRQVNSYEPPNSPEPPNSYGNAYGSSVMADGSNRDNKKEAAHGSDNASSKDKNKVDANVSNKVDNNNNINNASKDDEKLNNGVKRNGKASDKASNLNNKDDSNKDNSNKDNSNKDDSNKAGDSAKLDSKLEKSAKHRRVKRALNGSEGNEPWRKALELCKKEGRKTFAECYWFIYKSPDKIDRSKYFLEDSLGGGYPIPLYSGKTYSFDLKLVYYPFYGESVPIPAGTKFRITKIECDGGHRIGNSTDAIVQDWVSIDNNARITIHATSKWIYPTTNYRANIEIKYPDGSIGKDYFEFKHDDLGIRNHDLNINVYNNQNIDENKRNYGSVTLKKKNDGSYNSLNMLIDSTSKRGPGTIKHRMLCHKDSDTNYDFNSYSLDGIAGLKLKPLDSKTSSGDNSLNQLEWKINPGKNRASGNKNSGEELYEDDDYTERSQSLFTGTPNANSDGNYTCRIFAIKKTVRKYQPDFDHLIFTEYSKPRMSKRLIESREKLRQRTVKNLFKNTNGTFLSKPISVLFDDYGLSGLHVDMLPGDPEYVRFFRAGYIQSIFSLLGCGFQTIDWDYKTLKIHIGKDNPPSDNTGDLSLKVYSSKRQNNPSSEASSQALIDSNSGINVMNGIKFSTFINATSVNDNSKITLKTLCAKGEYAGKTSSDSDNDASENIFEQSGKGLIYQHWKDDFLDVSSQKSCTSNKSGLKTCDDGKFGAQTTADAEGKPLQMSEHKCVVYAFKPKALEEFSKITTNITPDKVDYALATANFVEAKDYAKFTFPIHIRFSLPNTGERNWNLQLGAIAAVMVSVLAAAFILNHLNWQREQAALRKAAVPM